MDSHCLFVPESGFLLSLLSVPPAPMLASGCVGLIIVSSQDSNINTNKAEKHEMKNKVNIKKKFNT
jgi:hypothetical protein